MTRIEEIQKKAMEAGDARFRWSERERDAYVLGRIHGGQWADHTMLNKVYDFIKINAYKYGKVKFVDNKAIFDFRTDTFLNDLKRAVEE